MKIKLVEIKKEKKYYSFFSNNKESFFNINPENNIDEESDISKKVEEKIDNSTIFDIKYKLEKIKIESHSILSEAFYNCKLLISLPDISNWKITKIYNMTHIFYKFNN